MQRLITYIATALAWTSLICYYLSYKEKINTGLSYLFNTPQKLQLVQHHTPYQKYMIGFWWILIIVLLCTAYTAYIRKNRPYKG